VERLSALLMKRVGTIREKQKREKKKALRDVVRESRRTVLLLCFARMTSVRTNEVVDGRRSL